MGCRSIVQHLPGLCEQALHVRVVRHHKRREDLGNCLRAVPLIVREHINRHPPLRDHVFAFPHSDDDAAADRFALVRQEVVIEVEVDGAEVGGGTRGNPIERVCPRMRECRLARDRHVNLIQVDRAGVRHPQPFDNRDRALLYRIVDRGVGRNRNGDGRWRMGQVIHVRQASIKWSGVLRRPPRRPGRRRAGRSGRCHRWGGGRSVSTMSASRPSCSAG